MSEPVLQLTYISTRHPTMTPTEIEHILDRARFHNRLNGVTGLLIFNGHRFLQHLEGPAEAVEETLARIRLDRRHRAIVLLDRREAEFRAFSRWSMAHERADLAEGAHRLALVAQVEAMVAGVNPRIADHFLGYARLTASKAA